MRIISLNICHGGGARKASQLASLQARQPDIVALVEYRTSSGQIYRDGFKKMGLIHSLDSFESEFNQSALPQTRINGVLVASRWPFRLLSEAETSIKLEWPERLLAVLVDTPDGEVELYAAYIPNVGTGSPKTQILEGIYRGLAQPSSRYRLLCGDFNTPMEETAAGEIITFGKRAKEDQPAKTFAEKLDVAERKVLVGLSQFGLEDVYRKLHGYEVQEYSYYHHATKLSFRLDHILASPSLNVVECRYLQDFLTNSWSDHAAIEAVFAPGIVVNKNSGIS